MFVKDIDSSTVTNYFRNRSQHIREITCYSLVTSLMSNTVSQCRYLTSFQCYLSSEYVDSCAVLQNNPQLQKLFIIVNLNDAQPEMFANIKLPKLVELTISVWRAYPECLVAAVGMAESLLRLSIVSTGDHFSLSVLQEAAKRCPHLRSLGLRAKLVRDEHLSTLTTLCPRIVNLDISNNDTVTDAGMLSIVQNLKGLRSLSVQICPLLTDMTVQHLYNYSSNTLEVLFLNNRLITQSAIDMLHAKCHPRLTLHSVRGIQTENGIHTCNTVTVLHMGCSPSLLFMPIMSPYTSRLEVLDLSPCSKVQLDLTLLDALCSSCPRLHTVVLKPRDRDEFGALLREVRQLRVTTHAEKYSYCLNNMPM